VCVGDWETKLGFFRLHIPGLRVILTLGPDRPHPAEFVRRHLVPHWEVLGRSDVVARVAIVCGEVVGPNDGTTLERAQNKVICERRIFQKFRRGSHLKLERVKTGRTRPINLTSRRSAIAFEEFESTHGKWTQTEAAWLIQCHDGFVEENMAAVVLENALVIASLDWDRRETLAAYEASAGVSSKFASFVAVGEEDFNMETCFSYGVRQNFSVY
jgi:hypothetical protein